jgi:uncharacterized protein YgiB involved in biofilm formation
MLNRGYFMGFVEAEGKKRSGRVGLSTMLAATTLAGTPLLSACGSEAPVPPAAPERSADSKDVQAFENVFECAAQTDLSQQECAEARKQAVAASAEVAPRFAGQGDCENEWGAGNCVSHNSGGSSFFMPFMTGFLVGKMLGGGRRDYLPLYRKAGDRAFSTANGVRLGYAGAPGKYYAAARALEHPRTVTAIKANSGAVARGGLVSAGSDGSSDRWGSSRSSSRWGRSFGG